MRAVAHVADVAVCDAERLEPNYRLAFDAQ